MPHRTSKFGETIRDGKGCGYETYLATIDRNNRIWLRRRNTLFLI